VEVEAAAAAAEEVQDIAHIPFCAAQAVEI
jgi:hypothetical protein